MATDSQPPFRVGVIGAGNISDAYLRIGQRFEVYEITHIADLEPARAAAKAEVHGIRACSVDELLGHGEIDIVLNLTVPAAHAVVSRAALSAGKHLYSEKPLATRREEGALLLELARERGLRIGCAPDTFLGAGLQSARAALEAGKVGQPLAATAFMTSSGPERWHPSPAFFYAPGAGPLFDMGPYYLTMLISLLGPIRSVASSAVIGRAARPILSAPLRGQLIEVTTPTHVSSLIEFASGAVATLLTSMDTPASELPRGEIYGSEATLSLPDPNTFGGPLRLRRADDQSWEELPLTRPYAENSRGLGLAEMAWAMRQGRPHRASGELAFHVLDAMQSMLEAAESRCYLDLASRCAQPAPLPAGAGEEVLR